MSKAPAFIQSYKKCMAIGCSHGEFADKDRLDEVIAFRDRFQPDIRFDLGDLIDTAAFRSGAQGSKDAARDPVPDRIAACDWIRRYEPTHVSWGNHCWRLVEWQGHPNAVVSYAASTVWEELQKAIRDVGAKTRPYHIEKGWFHMGGVAFGHGYMHNQNAVRDHAEMIGGRVVMAHVHTPEQVPGRVIGAGPSFCVGTLADVDQMHYADRNRSKTRWGAGIVFGEISQKEAHLWLVSAKPGQPLRFPPGL
jgi:hypothetical protein